MLIFYRAVIESMLTFSLIVWFGSSTAHQRSQINNITRVALKMIGHALNSSGIYASAFYSLYLIGHICIVGFMRVYVFMHVFNVCYYC